MTFQILIFTVSFIVLSCTRSSLLKQEDALRLTVCPSFQDSLPPESFGRVLKSNINFLKSGHGPSEFHFADRKLSRGDYVSALETILKSFGPNPFTSDTFQTTLTEHFDCYEVYGKNKWGEVLATSYFSPILEASHLKTKAHDVAIYLQPADLVSVQLNAFFQTFPNLKSSLESVTEKKSSVPILRGRRVQGGPQQIDQIIPYYSRGEIDRGQALKNHNLEIGWVDSVDAFFLHVQGSGILQFPKGEKIRVGYHSQNGHPYEALGKFLLDKIPLEAISMQAIEDYLRTLGAEDRLKFMAKNPSYVFFKKVSGEPASTLGTEVVAGRSIASDPAFFDKGTLAFLETDVPVFDSPSSKIASSWKSSPRFVFDQDTGGAIRGGGHVDLYWGEGNEAKQAAGLMKQVGRLVYLVPKPEHLKQQ